MTDRLVAVDGVYTNTFDCAALFGAGQYPCGALIAKLIKMASDRTGAAIGLTGDVLVIDVSGGSSATSYPTVEYTNADLGTFNCDI